MATLLPVHRAAIVNLYSALFNRAPDASGLSFWAQAYADGASLTGITQSFMGTPEGRVTYPAAQTSAQFVAAFYQTVFGRAADAGGLAFWTTALDAAGGAGSDAARAALAGQIVGVENQTLVGRPDGLSDAAYTQTVADRALFANKAVVGDYVASLNINDVVLARKVLALVTQDPGSIPIAKAFAANGGITPAPPEPSAPPAIVFLVTNADSEANIITKFATYAGTTAAVDASGMNAAKLSAVAGGIAKIDSGGIHGTLALDVPGYTGATLTTLAPKLALDATLTVTGSNAADTITLKEFQRGTNIYALDGDDIFSAVVDATTPSNTTLSARHGLVGGAGTDTLRIEVTGNGVAALNGAALASIETVQVFVDGSATLAANAGVSKVIVVGPPPPAVLPTPVGSLAVSGLAAGATLVLDHTTSASSFTANYVAGATTALLNLNAGAQADVVTIAGIGLTALNIVNANASSLVTSLTLGSNISSVDIVDAGGMVISGLSGGVASSLALTVSSSGPFRLSGVMTPGVSFDGSASTGNLVLSFDQAVGTVKGGSAFDVIQVSSSATLTGNGGPDVFNLLAGVGQTATINLASLNAKMVTITDFSSTDRISVETPVPPSTGGSFALQVFTGTGADLYLQTASVAAQMQALVTKVPYAGFTFGGASYILVDNNLDGLGVGDMLIRLVGSPTLSSITYEDTDLTMT